MYFKRGGGGGVRFFSCHKNRLFNKGILSKISGLTGIFYTFLVTFFSKLFRLMFKSAQSGSKFVFQAGISDISPEVEHDGPRGIWWA